MIAPKVCSLFVFLLAPLLLCAGNVVTKSLTVLMDFEAPHSDASLQSLRTSLHHILGPTGMNIDVQVRSDVDSHAQFGELVIFKMKGSCTLSAVSAGPIYDERGPLAMAYTSDGQVLHFGEVECDRVRRSLQRVLGRNTSAKSQREYGSALAVVMAHEVYHMLGNVVNHTRSGLTKAELSASELLDNKVSLPAVALDRMGGILAADLP